MRKTPTEQFTIAVDFKDRTPPGETLASGTLQATNQFGTDTTVLVLSSATASVDGTSLKAFVRSGTVGDTHDILFTATFSGGSVTTSCVNMRIVRAC